MNVVAIIPARGGSKRLPNKNLFPICGKPLITHTIEQALSTQLIGDVFVSSDSQAILDIARDYPEIYALERNSALAGDNTSTETVLYAWIEEAERILPYFPDVIVLLQCTSPVREPEDIDGCIGLVTGRGYDSALSVVPYDKFLWSTEGRPINYDPRHRPRSQDFEGQYQENGSIYAFTVDGWRTHRCRLFGKIGLWKMGKGESFEIDTAFDAWLCEQIMSGWKDAPARTKWFQDKGAEEQWMDFHTYQLATE